MPPQLPCPVGATSPCDAWLSFLAPSGAAAGAAFASGVFVSDVLASGAGFCTACGAFSGLASGFGFGASSSAARLASTTGLILSFAMRNR